MKSALMTKNSVGPSPSQPKRPKLTLLGVFGEPTDDRPAPTAPPTLPPTWFIVPPGGMIGHAASNDSPRTFAIFWAFFSLPAMGPPCVIWHLPSERYTG